MVGGAFIGVGLLTFVLIAVGWAVWSLISMLMMNEISLFEFIVYIGVFLGLVLGGLSCGEDSKTLGAGALLLAGLLGVSFSFMRKWMNLRGIAQMDREDIDKYQKIVHKHPERPFPYQRIGEIYMRQGHYKAAAEWFAMALELGDDPEVKQRLKRCNAVLNNSYMKQKVCSDCQAQNPQDARYCIKCGSMLPGWWEIIAAFRGRQGARVLLYSFLLSLLIAIILSILDLIAPIVVMLLYLIAGAALVYYWYKRITTI